MATVVRGPDWGSELNALLAGIGMIKDRIVSNRYKDKVNKLLGGYDETKEIEESPIKMQVEGATFGDRQQAQQIPMRRPLTPEEIMQARSRLMMGLEGAKAGLPAGVQTADIGNIFPSMGNKKSLEEIEAEQKIRSQYRVPQLFRDMTGNVYNANTSEGMIGIKQAARQGLRPERIPTDQSSKLVEQMYQKDRFMVDPDEAIKLEQKRRESIYTPEERKELTLKNHFETLDKIYPETKFEKQIIDDAKKQLRKYKAKDWDNLTDKDFEMLGNIIRKARNQIDVKRYKVQEKKVMGGKTYIKRNGEWYEQ